MRKINRGEIYYADLNPVMGSEQGGVRPILIVQNDTGNRHSPTVIVAAITTRNKIAMPTHVILTGLECLKEPSIVLLEQLRTIDKVRLKEYIGKISEKQIFEINHALAISLGLIPNIKKPIELCLCSICAEQFYQSKHHNIERVDKNQKIKEKCTYCDARYGFDYRITGK